MRRPTLTLLATLVALLVACDDGPGTGELPADTGPADAMAGPDAEPDAGPAEPDAAPDGQVAPAECVFPDIERGSGVVETTRGVVRGREDDGVWVWQGIPYAAPPVGELRFRAPEPAACWSDVLDADGFGPACVQIDFEGGGLATTGEEDCLTLNVWSPVGAADGTARPVLVFIHGGANIIGSAREEVAPGAPLYDGQALAARGDAVVVTLQYRLGPLGFLSLPELDAEDANGTSGNQALLDQLAALRWVQDNIAAFGGDPARVMVFGESAGAINTCMMVATPLSEGLLHAALMQSGGCGAAPKAAAQAGSATAAERLSCAGDDRLACLRGLDAAQIMQRASGSVGIGVESDLSWGPSVDGYVLPTAPLDRFAAGEHVPVPVVVGSNRDEMASRALNQVTVESPEDYTAAVEMVFGVLGDAAVQRIFAAYPVDAFESPDDAFIQVLTDSIFTCATRRVARVLAAGQDAPVYRYFFARRFVTAMGEGRAAHGIELLYVFRTLEDIPFYVPAPGERAVADQMMDAWLNLAATGDPSGGAAGEWPPYAEDELSLIFDDPVRTEAGVRGELCDMWEELVGDLL